MRHARLFAVLSTILLSALAGHCATLPPVIRGNHTLLLRAEAGTLQVKLYKRDLNIYPDPDPLTGLLYDGQRRLVATLELPDDGLPQGKAASELQSAEATLPGAAAGVYRLQVTGSGDSVFGLQTTAPGCVVQGDLVLNDGAIGGRLLFAPPAEKFAIAAQALHAPGEQQMPLFDAAGKVLNTFDLSHQGVDSRYEVPAGARDGLWRFDIGKMDVKLVLDKPVLWTLDSSAWFDPLQSRWLLLPHRQALYLQPGGAGRLKLNLLNESASRRRYLLQISAPPGLEVAVETPASPVEVPAKAQVPVTVALRLKPGAQPNSLHDAALTAQAEDDAAVAATAGLQVRAGLALAEQPLSLPIVLRRYEHENWQFGYVPDYEPNEIYFDRDNRPYMRQRGSGNYLTTGIQMVANGQWVERPFVEAIREAFPEWRGAAYGAGGFLGAKIAFDGQNGAYTLLRLSLPKGNQSVLVYTPDAGQHYGVYPFTASDFDIEQFTGHNALTIPPPILTYRFVKEHPAEFAGYYDLGIMLPRKEAERLVLPEPVPVAQNCLGSCQHSGGPASTATREGKTHIVWGEIAPDDAPGVPEYVATYDHASGKVGEKVLLGYAPPVNDVHNVPAICQDSKGYLHVVLGAHGQAFQYTRSLKPNDAYGGWTKPVPVLGSDWIDDKNPAPGRAGQTYVSLVCDREDTLHIAYRQWRRNADSYHPGQLYAALSVQSKPDGQPWGPARPVVIPPVPGYSIYYHKLTIDRADRLYLSYSYWADDQTYQSDFPDRYHFRTLLSSDDHGAHWRLVTKAP